MEGNMSAPTVATVTRADAARAIDTIVLAFATDPVLRWIWPTADRYLANAPDFARAFCSPAFDTGGAFVTQECAGVALWLRPDVHSDDAAMGQIVQRSMSQSSLADLGAFAARMAEFHPTEPHWYLPMIGVDPAWQGSGHGAALMKYALQQVDREHLPAYLESSSSRNISLYQRHGFEIVGTIQVGSSPTMVPMRRPPR
jgi:ribosomal protein S18 acetylase RimI-like enzyme